MKSAIEEHGLERTVCSWWRIAVKSASNAHAVLCWLHGAGSVHSDEAVSDELFMLSNVLFTKRMLT